MIISIKNKALKEYWEHNKTGKLDGRYIRTIQVILTTLDSAMSQKDLIIPGKRLHQLNGFDPTRWSLDVSANWRITFEWDGRNVSNVDYEDTH